MYNVYFYNSNLKFTSHKYGFVWLDDKTGKNQQKKLLLDGKTGNFQVKTPGFTENIIGGNEAPGEKEPVLT